MRACLLVLAIAAGLTACDSLDTFDVPVEGQTEIPGSPLGGVPIVNQELPFPGLTSFNFQDSKTFRDNDISADDIESVTLTSLRLSVVEPAGGNLDFLESVEFFVEAQGVQRRKLAAKAPIPDGVGSVELDVVDLELKPYATANEMTITTLVSGSPPSETVRLKARAVFEVNAAVF